MQSVTFTATVAQIAGPAQPTGTIQFSVDGVAVGGAVTLSGGTAAFTISTLAVGVHTVTAVYTPDAGDFTGSNGSIGQRVGAVATSATTLSVAPTTVMYGDTATLTAVVTPSFATGTVSFYEGTTLLGTASLDNTATAVLPISTLNAGVHNITAKYNGDPGVPANTSNTVQLTVTKRTAPGGGPAITVTVNDASRTTTQSNPPFTYSPSGQLVNGDTLCDRDQRHGELFNGSWNSGRHVLDHGLGPGFSQLHDCVCSRHPDRYNLTLDDNAGGWPGFNAVWRSGHADGNRYIGRDRHGELL